MVLAMLWAVRVGLLVALAASLMAVARLRRRKLIALKASRAAIGQSTPSQTPEFGRHRGHRDTVPGHRPAMSAGASRGPVRRAE